MANVATLKVAPETERAKELVGGLSERAREISDTVLKGGGSIVLSYGKTEADNAAVVAEAVRLKMTDLFRNVPAKALNEFVTLEGNVLSSAAAKARGYPSGAVNYFEVVIKVKPEFWVYRNASEPDRVLDIVASAPQNLEESEKGLFKRRISTNNPERVAAAMTEMLGNKMTVAYAPDTVKEKDGKKSYMFVFYNTNVEDMRKWLSDGIDSTQEQRYGVPRKTPELAALAVEALTAVVNSNEKYRTALKDGRLTIGTRESEVQMFLTSKAGVPATELSVSSAAAKTEVSLPSAAASGELKTAAAPAEAVGKEATRIERTMQDWITKGAAETSKPFVCTTETFEEVSKFAKGMYSVKHNLVALNFDEKTFTITLTRAKAPKTTAAKPAAQEAPKPAAQKPVEKPAVKPAAKPAATEAPVQVDAIFQPLMDSLGELDEEGRRLAKDVTSIFKRLSPDNKRSVAQYLKGLSEDQPEWYKSTFYLNELLKQLKDLEKPKPAKR